MIDMDPDTHYSNIEVEDQLMEFLTEANITKLINIFTAKGCDALAGMSGSDVLHHIVEKALAMERKWPREEKAMPYLIKTGESVIDNANKKRERLHSVESVDDYLSLPENERDSVSPISVSSHPPSHTALQEKQSGKLISEWVTKIMDLFSDDEEASCFLKKKLSNIIKARIMELCAFTDQMYRNIEKRIKYKVRNKFPNGIPWWEIKE